MKPTKGKPSSQNPQNELYSFLERLLLGASCLYLAMYLIIALLRIGYPFELEWMEGGAVDHVYRVLHGQLLYVRPTIEFIPAIYTPLYYYLSAGLASLTGNGFFSLRLVSVLSSLSAFALIFLIVRRETSRWQHGLIAAGLYAATYRICGAWFDIGRADSLFVVLLLMSLFLLRLNVRTRNLVLAAVALWLAFLTKQSALIVALPMSLWAIAVNWRRGLIFALPLATLVVISTWVLNFIHEGWFYYYVFELPARHKIDPGQYLGFWTHDILKTTLIVTALSALTVIQLVRRGDRNLGLLYLAVLLGCLGSSWSSMLHSGGYDNVLMPSMAALAVTTLPVLPLGWKGKLEPRQFSASWFRIAAPLVILLQFVLLIYDPSKQVPSRATEQAGRELIQSISKVPGEVYMPYHGYLPVLAGKTTYAHYMAFKDVTRADTAMERELNDELARAYAKHRFALVILDSPSPFPALRENYIMTNVMPEAVMRYWPLTGMPTRPRFWYVPR